jgi:long-subunit acyl-CoA synthetase (AMP-forming)
MTNATGERARLDGPALDAATVPAAFQRTVARYPDKVALQTLDGTERFTWTQAAERVRSLAAGLAAHGIGPGDTVAIMLPNTIECHLVDYAALHLGAVPFAIFNSAPAVQIEHQLRVADCTLVITQHDFLDKVREGAAALGDQVRHIFVVDGPESPDVVRPLAEMEAAGAADFDFDAAWQAVTPDDLASLVYTSGTTGPPKGAQISHHSVMSAQRAMDAALPLPTDDIISFMPMAHAGGRITVHYMALAYGATVTTCPDIKQLIAALTAVHPDAFFAVPRFFEKIQVAIEAMVHNEPEPVRSALQQAIATGLARTRAADSGSAASAEELAALDIAHAGAIELLKPILARVGLDRIKSAFVGGAPSTPELSQFFRAVGVPMLEAYGLTEGSLNIFNQVELFKSGSAGKPLPGVEIRLSDDGELLVRSALNFTSYRHQPDATAEAIDTDGWLHTGDIAVIDDQGFVSIVDRKKELIINSSGKNMSPVTIESAIKAESSLIGQCVAIGDRRSYVTALITLDPESLATHAKRLGVATAAAEDLASSPAIRQEIEDAVARGNRKLNSNEQIKKFTVLSSVWLPDSDELTPTAKVKRRVINTKYAKEIEDLYA